MKKPKIVFDIISIFPNMFSYFNESILKRAQDKNIIKINIHNLRDYTTDKHKKVDDTPTGGGAGMVMKVEPFYNAVKKIKGRKKNTHVVILSAKGKVFTQKDARRLAKYKNLILLCGRYEGVDERVVQYIADEEISIGEYVLSGGELGAMIITDAVSRMIEGVIGSAKSLKDESYNQDNYLEYPQYTKPEHFSPKQGTKWSIPSVLLSGNHAKIKKWRNIKN